MPPRELHNADDADDVIIWHALVKQIAHRVHENSLRLAPEQRLSHLFRDQAQIESLLIWVAWNSTEALRESLRVAMGTTGGDLGTTPDGVPGRVRPLY